MESSEKFIKMRVNEICIIFLLQIYITIRIVFGFNLSPVPNEEFKYPETETKEESTYFGYSLVLRENSIIIGAPRANVSTHGSVKSPGAVFQCLLLISARNKGCKRLAVDERNSSYNRKLVLHNHPFWDERSYYIKSVNRNNSYLGATMDGGPGENDSLMICAPHFGACNEGFDCMQGICYWTANFNSADFIKNRFLMNDYRNQGNFYHDLAQMGFSLEVTNNYTAIMGAPGFDQWRGASVLFHDKLQISKLINKAFGYNGYAVSAGHLNGSNYEEIMFVSSAPHGSYYKKYKNEDVSGLVYIFDKNRVLKYLLESETADFGEFFGYAVQVEDVDNDKWDDILVGAPFHVGVHSNCTDCSDVGVVYLYKNTAKDNFFGGLSFEKNIIKSPFGSKARFGSSIAKLGDINLDGYNDIAIGAPFAYGTGAVAIYFGSENGLKTDPTSIQILKPTEQYQNSMFGFVISRGVDTDRNGYNDVAIGAPLSESVFYYRAYPVVEVVATINTTEAIIPINSKKLKILICYKFKTQSQYVKRVNIFLIITLDKQYRRFSFLPLNSATLRRTKVATTNNQCETLIAQNNGTQVREIFQEIPMNVKIILVNDAKKVGKKFCANCVATTSEINLQQMNASHMVYYDNKCNGSCRSVDLSIRHAKVPKDITFGLNKTITVHYEIMNKGGRAYQPQLIIETNPRLNFKKSPLCSPIGSKVSCDLIKFENETSETLIVETTYEVSELIDCDEILITANVGSITLDEHQEDNNIESRIRIHRHSVLELLGKPDVNTIELNDTNVIYDLEYKLLFTNLGPSKLKNANLFIALPYQFNGNSFIQLNETNIEIDHQIIDFIPITEDLFQYQNQTERNLLISEYKLNAESLKIWDCYTINGISCVQSNILFGVINPGDHKIINLNLRLSSRDIKKSNTETWLLKLNASFTLDKRNYSEVNTEIKLQPIIIHNYQRPKLPLWIWIISGAIGLFLLSLVTWFLVRKGFFKRQTKEDMEKRLIKEMEQEYMNAAIQRNIRESFRKCATEINQEELEFHDSSK